MSDLPNPLTPADCDLRGYTWMPLDVVRVIDSDTFGLSTGDEFKTAFRLWAKSWLQVPAASLPDDDRLLAHLAGLSENMPKWKKVRAIALRGFVKCSDGRLYHPVIAEKAIEAMGKREARDERDENTQTRQQQHRERRKAMFEQLRQHGIVPAWDTKTAELERLVASLGSPQPVTQTVTPETQSVTGSVTGDVTCDAPATANTGQDITGQDSKPVGTVIVTDTSSVIARDDDQTVPATAADWCRYFAERHGLELDATSVHDRRKAWPLFAAWTNAGITRGRMDRVIAKAQAEATSPIAFLPAYADRVLASMSAPRANGNAESREAFNERENARAKELLFGSENDHAS
ncbi:DUF1376 domain-containing protein [Burkholderia cepacia]|uniref:DUF1376 domain-containing protein n=1 Tax=Burkholderia cepacia TaxID=292 RepID=UPI001CF358BE|nr:DUF1376 domain-containing protein [Burkholderia cepacia]MCA8326106.1 YdaU family protein [Burkholderia cepacia]